MRWLDLEAEVKEYFRKRWVDNAEKLVDELTYGCYANDRRLYPNTPIELNRHIFGAQTDALEARYQKELADERQDALRLAEFERRSGCYED